MGNEDWDTLVSQWKAVDTPSDLGLQRRVLRHRRWHRLGLMSELFGTIFALAMAAWVWPDAAALRPWLVAASTLIVAWQAGYLLIRRRYRLFGAPVGGLIGLIDAEIRRAKYMTSYLWFGIAGGILLIPLAMLTFPASYRHLLVQVLLLAAAWCIPYAVFRTWRTMRAVGALRSQRTKLAE